MTNAEHIVEWGMNDRGLYRCSLEIRSLDPAKAGGTHWVASDATRWARDAYTAGRRANDIPDHYTAADICEAAAIMLRQELGE